MSEPSPHTAAWAPIASPDPADAFSGFWTLPPIRRVTTSRCLLVWACTLLFFLPLSGQDLLPMPDRGPHPVGFRLDHLLNPARAGCPDTAGRPLMLGIWYPALKPGTGESMRLRDYLDFKGLAGADEDLVAATRKLHRRSWMSYTMADYGDSSLAVTRAAFERFLELPCHARLGAEPAPGRFPVVIYHHGAGGTYDDNARACEYLAGHGYLVVSGTFLQCEGEVVFEGTDWQSHLSDLQAILAHIRDLPQADPRRVGLIGHSRGSQIGYAAISGGNSPYSCFVALDPTWDGKTFVKACADWGQPSLLRFVEERKLETRVPILHMASFRSNSGIPTDSAVAMDARHEMQFPVTSLLLHASRVMVTCHPDAEHESYISQGALDLARMLGTLTDEEDQDYCRQQIRHHQFVNSTILAYLDHWLKPGPVTSARWEQAISGLSWEQDRVRVSVAAARPIPRRPEEWELLLLRHGVDTLAPLLDREVAEAGYHRFSYEQMAGRLFQEDRTLAKQLVDHYAATHPGHWKGPFLQGLFAFNVGDVATGRRCYDRALELSPPEDERALLEQYSYWPW